MIPIPLRQRSRNRTWNRILRNRGKPTRDMLVLWCLFTIFQPALKRNQSQTQFYYNATSLISTPQPWYVSAIHRNITQRIARQGGNVGRAGIAEKTAVAMQTFILCQKSCGQGKRERERERAIEV